MKKNLAKLGVLIAILGIAAFAVTREEATAPPKTLTIEGYASAEELAAEKTRGILDGPADITYPIDEILISQRGATTRMLRSGEGKELNWTLEEPLKSAAVKFRVEKLIKLFKERTTSVHSKSIKPDDHALFDFEAERRIRLTLKSKGVVWQGADLIIGRVEESESQTAQGGISKDTWVMRADDETVAYRIAGKDLRTESETPLSDLRDKKLFTVEADDIVNITLKAPSGETLVLSGERSEASAAEPAKASKAKVSWTLSTPKGYALDESVTSFVRNITNARTKAFIPEAQGPKEGLGDALWHLRGRDHQGEAFGLRFANEGDPAWAQVDGRKEWVQLDTYTLKNLQKTLADLREKTLWSLPEADISAVTFGAAEGKGVHVVRQESGWTMGQGAPADMSQHLRQLAKLKAKRYAEPGELEGAKASLSTPYFNAELRAGEKSVNVVVGPELQSEALKNHHWAQVNGGEPVLLASFNAKRLLKGADELALKRFFDLERSAIMELSVTHPDKTVVSLKRAAAGAPLELSELPEGKIGTKAPAVGTMSGTLPNLKAKSFEGKISPQEAGLVAEKSYRVRILDDKGVEHLLLVSSVSSGPDPYAMALTGPLAKRVATISNFQALNLQKKASELSE